MYQLNLSKVIIPELTYTRFVVAGADVIHSYACPSLGIKYNAMPLSIRSTSLPKFLFWLYDQIEG